MIAAHPTPHHVKQYKHVYREVRRHLGHRAPGRNIIRWGLANGHRPTDAQVVKSIGVLERALAPAPVVAVTAPAPATASVPAPSPAVTSPTPVGGAGGVPACASESGTNYSTGPSNTNASSGATGRYQIIPSTAAGYGCNLSTPAGQDACAGVIYRNQGAGAWVGCGG